MKKGEVMRMRGSHRLCTLIVEDGNQWLVDFDGKKKWVRTEDLMLPIEEGNKWMRPFVDHDVLYTFFRWLLSDTMERRIQIAVALILTSFVIFQAVRYVFSV